MTPPASSFKKGAKEPPLTAVVILDVFDQRFAPIQESYPCFGTIPICNVPAVNFVLSWLLRTEVKNVQLVVSGLNAQHAENVQKEWKLAFNEFNVIACDGVSSVGDCMRELVNRELIQGDFMLITNPTAVVSTSLSTQIESFRIRRREHQDNVMTLLYSHRENPENSLLGINWETQKLMLYPAANSLNQLKAEKHHFYEGCDIRKDLTTTGIAFCSRMIATQFSDNFDFTGIDDVVREILSKDDILGMSVHIEVLTPKERAFCAYDYESLILLNTLMLERWFYPLVPERSDPSRYITANPRNLYLEEDGNEICLKANTWILGDQCFTTSLGQNTRISYESRIQNSSIGSNTEIAKNSHISFSIIGKNCKIGENCQIEYAFIGDNVTIPDGVRIPRETIIGNGVVYLKEMPTGMTNLVVVKEGALSEEKYDKLSSSAIGSVHVAKFRHGGPFWRRAVDGKTNFAVTDDKDSDRDSDSTSVSSDDGIDDSIRQFHDEVLESMEKILESANQQMANLILEINSSKLACNVTMDDVAKNVFAAFLELPHNGELKETQQLIIKWRDLFSNYYKTRRCQVHLLLAVEDRYNAVDAFRARVPKLVHFMYNVADILEEEAILEWAESIETETLKTNMQPIVDWLQEEDDEDEEEEE